MNIGIDCSQVSAEPTGVGLYEYNLVSALSRVDKENSYRLYPVFYGLFLRGGRKEMLPNTGNFRVAFSGVPSLLVKPLWAPVVPAALKELMLGDVDVVHSTTYSAPRLRDRKKRLVATIYDLTVITHPECHRRQNVRICVKGIRDALRYADAIIAISEHTKRDMIEHLKCPAELISVTHLAADPMYHPVDDPAVRKRVRDKYGLPERYILFIGSLEPRKNVSTLIHSYSRLPERLKREFSLVVAGAKGWKNSDIYSTVKKIGVEDKVRFAGYIDKDDISAVYSMATVFVYPSLYEGFGLPILEAMACGTPVITSNTSSMPEVAGTAAEFITPTDTEEITEALRRVLEDETLMLDMRRRGLERSSKFTWERCARETLEVYKKVFEAGGRLKKR